MSRDELAETVIYQEYGTDDADLHEEEFADEDTDSGDSCEINNGRKNNEFDFNQELRLVNAYFKEVGHEMMLSPTQELEIAAKLTYCRTRAGYVRKEIASILESGARSGTAKDIQELKCACANPAPGKTLGVQKCERLKKLAAVLESYEQSAKRLKKRFVSANLRLVASMAKKYVGRGVPFLDIIQEGNLGLMKAVDKFDHKKGNRFSTYASWWINQAMTRGIYNQKRTVKVPAYVLEKSGKVWRERAKFVKKNGREPEPGEISSSVNMSTQNVKHVLEYNNVNNMVRLDAAVWAGRPATFMDFMEDSDTMPVETLMAEVSIPANVGRALQNLEVRQQEIIRMRFGIGYPGTFTLDEIGKRLGLTRERIRQIERKALDTIRNSESAPALRSLFEIN